jgi:hypothetical protein
MTDDLDDLERGYFVYLHRDRASGLPFYVGKGKGRRAHVQEGRHPDWTVKVESLPEGFDVEIVKDDLSEEEAYDLERELIREYGKARDDTGTLVNVTDGGSLDFGELSVEVRVELPDKVAKAMQADYEARRYRTIVGEERAALSKSLVDLMSQLRARYEAASVEDEETDFDLGVDGVVWNAWNLADKFSKRKVSSKDFGYELESLCEMAEDDLEDSEGEKPEMVTILKECKTVLEKLVADLKEPPTQADQPGASPL